jgi:hypothetical protein
MNKIPTEELQSRKYGRLTIVKEISPHIKPSGKTARKFLCRCDCGKAKTALLDKLRRGRIKSCGCFYKESRSTVNRKHGLSYHPLMRVHGGLVQRCKNKNDPGFSHYGGRGISVCLEWLADFKSFYDWAIQNGYKKGLEIDRINNDGNYEPSNCRFVTKTQNARNKRSTVLTVPIVEKIKEMNITLGWGNRKIANKLGLNPGTVMNVLSKRTWGAEERYEQH